MMPFELLPCAAMHPHQDSSNPKGSALSTMVGLMAGALIGDCTSQANLAFNGGEGTVKGLGHLVLAFDPTRMAGDNWPASQQRAEDLFASFTNQGARLSSERRFAARAVPR